VADLASIADKLRPLIRLLSSDHDGEVVAAARALTRTLKNAKLDIHVLANSVGQANGKLSKAEMQKLYDAGFEAGRRAAENGPVFRNVNLDDEPSWHEIATECAGYPRQRFFGEHERLFVQRMVRKTVHGGEPSAKEGSWLRKIYARGR
jgi:hypothetical protein